MGERKHSHYFKSVEGLKDIDVYRVLQLFNVADPCLQHAVKKLLVAGGRGGGKDITRDIAYRFIDDPSVTAWRDRRRHPYRQVQAFWRRSDRRFEHRVVQQVAVAEHTVRHDAGAASRSTIGSPHSLTPSVDTGRAVCTTGGTWLHGRRVIAVGDLFNGHRRLRVPV